MDDETFNPKEKLKTCNENTGPFSVLRNASPTQHCAGKAILTLLYISRLLMLTLKNSHCCGSRRDLRIAITRKCPGIFTRDTVVHDNARSHVASGHAVLRFSGRCWPIRHTAHKSSIKSVNLDFANASILPWCFGSSSRPGSSWRTEFFD